MKIKILVILSLMLAGCSSPPEPTPVEFEKANIAINGTMEVSVSKKIIPSSLSIGGWSHSFVYTKDLMPTIDNYYAIAHADSAEIIINDEKEYVLIENWLIEKGLVVKPTKRVNRNNLFPVINLNKE